MRSGLLHWRIAELHLRPDAPWPSEVRAAHAAARAARVESDPMNTTATPTENSPVFAPSTGQILPFPVASCRNLSN